MQWPLGGYLKAGFSKEKWELVYKGLTIPLHSPATSKCPVFSEELCSLNWWVCGHTWWSGKIMQLCVSYPQSTPTNIPSDTTRDEILGATLLKVRGSNRLPSSTTIYLAHQGSQEFFLLCLETLVLRHGLSLELYHFIHKDPCLTKLQMCSIEKRAKSASRENSYTIPLPTKF